MCLLLLLNLAINPILLQRTEKLFLFIFPFFSYSICSLSRTSIPIR
ncbi:Hypothetical protein Minf_0858 [Methylacidiphilum infernorum V4]|uniref:Uncharacterized protein n=1 Tax=Methylacidiphilum infernorum (isolate V4) TaxID=481448 RepID=B3E1B7_METI4|nr:Hypothetical protein Minf_0858 [Methylacidiphilum infernorum V4]